MLEKPVPKLDTSGSYPVLGGSEEIVGRNANAQSFDPGCGRLAEVVVQRHFAEAEIAGVLYKYICITGAKPRQTGRSFGEVILIGFIIIMRSAAEVSQQFTEVHVIATILPVKQEAESESSGSLLRSRNSSGSQVLNYLPLQ